MQEISNPAAGGPIAPQQITDVWQYLDRDAVFAVKPSLLRRFEPRNADDPDRPAGIAQPRVSLNLDLILARGIDRIGVIDSGRTH